MPRDFEIAIQKAYEDEIKELKAELAAEREKTRQARELASIRGLEAAGLSSERDALREALRDLWHGHDLDAEFIARIDAALKGGGDD